MSTKKVSTPRTASKPTSDELRKQLARDIAAVLNNSECPNIVFNGLAESLNDLFNSLPREHGKIDESEPYITLLLDANARAESEKGGAS
jgi:hypothetical protein